MNYVFVYGLLRSSLRFCVASLLFPSLNYTAKFLINFSTLK